MKKILTVFLLIIAIFTSTLVIYSNNRKIDKSEIYDEDNSRYNQLQDKTNNFEERSAGDIKNPKRIEIKYTDNINNKNVKKLEDIKGFIKDEDLKDGAYYINKELLTYKSLINKSSEIDLDISIAENRLIYVTSCHYPNGFNHRRGFVENAVLTKYYDAETGEFLGYSIKSLNKDGNKISRKN